MRNRRTVLTAAAATLAAGPVAALPAPNDPTFELIAEHKRREAEISEPFDAWSQAQLDKGWDAPETNAAKAVCMAAVERSDVVMRRLLTTAPPTTDGMLAVLGYVLSDHESRGVESDDLATLLETVRAFLTERTP